MRNHFSSSPFSVYSGKTCRIRPMRAYRTHTSMKRVVLTVMLLFFYHIGFSGTGMRPQSGPPTPWFPNSGLGTPMHGNSVSVITNNINQLAFYIMRHKKRSQYQVCQEGIHPEFIQTASMLCHKLEYIHHNLVLRGWVHLPEHWRYRSARNHLYNNHTFIEVDCSSY